jgi:hypothetical protein
MAHGGREFSVRSQRSNELPFFSDIHYGIDHPLRQTQGMFSNPYGFRHDELRKTGNLAAQERYRLAATSCGSKQVVPSTPVGLKPLNMRLEVPVLDFNIVKRKILE